MNSQIFLFLMLPFYLMILEAYRTLTQRLYVSGSMFGYMTVGWGLGVISGPIVSGLAASPCGRIPGMPLCGSNELNSER
jgi:hypothetical protein